MSNVIQEIEREQMSREVPEFGPGDTLVVKVSLVDMKGLDEYLVHHYRMIKALTADRV